VEVAIEAGPDGHRIRLAQQGFPTTQARDEFAGAWRAADRAMTAKGWASSSIQVARLRI